MLALMEASGPAPSAGQLLMSALMKTSGPAFNKTLSWDYRVTFHMIELPRHLLVVSLTQNLEPGNANSYLILLWKG